MRFTWNLLRKTSLLMLMCVSISACDQLRSFFEISHPVEHLVPHVLSTRPHDANAFTQGLLYAEGYLYESTGRYGESTLREVDPETGVVLRSLSLPESYFGEGLALVGDHLFQITWREGLGFIYDRETFTLLDTFPLAGEGWGICYDGDHLFISDGSAQITQLSVETLAPIAALTVTLDDQPVDQINELECVADSIYANVWHTDAILRIDKASGRVTALIDASNLLTPEQRMTLAPQGVLNGIAYDSERDTFLITGKLWSWLFEVQFVAP